MVSGVSSSAVFGLAPMRAGRGVAAPKAGGSASGDGANGAASGIGAPLTADQQQRVQELQRADANVRQHEAAHQAAGGPHAGGASFTYTRGPDGKNYATAGEVPVDTSPEKDPQATIRKMDMVKAAALAPNDPSPQDERVAAQADAAKSQAQQDLRKQESGGTGGRPTDANARSADAPSGENGTAAPALAARGAAAYGAAMTLGRPVPRAGITV